jgi:hypothetical protein
MKFSNYAFNMMRSPMSYLDAVKYGGGMKQADEDNSNVNPHDPDNGLAKVKQVYS